MGKEFPMARIGFTMSPSQYYGVITRAEDQQTSHARKRGRLRT